MPLTLAEWRKSWSKTAEWRGSGTWKLVSLEEDDTSVTEVWRLVDTPANKDDEEETTKKRREEATHAMKAATKKGTKPMQAMKAMKAMLAMKATKKMKAPEAMQPKKKKKKKTET